jgi:hypothetical protein
LKLSLQEFPYLRFVRGFEWNRLGSLGGALSVHVVAWKERAEVTAGRGWFKRRSLEISADLEKAITGEWDY